MSSGNECSFTRHLPSIYGFLDTTLTSCFSVEILKDEFPKIPAHYIERTQAQKTHLYPAYMELVESQYKDKPLYGPAGWRVMREVNFPKIIVKYGPATASLEAELIAARKARTEIEVDHRKEAARKKAEEANIERSKAEGAVAEWYVLYVRGCSKRLAYADAVLHALMKAL